MDHQHRDSVCERSRWPNFEELFGVAKVLCALALLDFSSSLVNGRVIVAGRIDTYE